MESRDNHREHRSSLSRSSKAESSLKITNSRSSGLSLRYRSRSSDWKGHSVVWTVISRNWSWSIQRPIASRKQSTIECTAWRAHRQWTTVRFPNKLPKSQCVWPCRGNQISPNILPTSQLLLFWKIWVYNPTLTVCTKPRPYDYFTSSWIRHHLLCQTHLAVLMARI